MWYAIFPGDDYYHLVKSQTNYTPAEVRSLTASVRSRANQLVSLRRPRRTAG